MRSLCTPSAHPPRFDLRTLRVLRRTHAGDDADAVLYDPASRRVISFNGDPNSASVIDPVLGRLLATIPLGALLVLER